MSSNQHRFGFAALMMMISCVLVWKMKAVQVPFQFLTCYVVFYAFWRHRDSVAPRTYSRSQMFLSLSDVRCKLVLTEVYGVFDSLRHNVQWASIHRKKKALFTPWANWVKAYGKPVPSQEHSGSCQMCSVTSWSRSSLLLRNAPFYHNLTCSDLFCTSLNDGAHPLCGPWQDWQP